MAMLPLLIIAEGQVVLESSVMFLKGQTDLDISSCLNGVSETFMRKPNLPHFSVLEDVALYTI